MAGAHTSLILAKLNTPHIAALLIKYSNSLLSKNVFDRTSLLASNCLSDEI